MTFQMAGNFQSVYTGDLATVQDPRGGLLVEGVRPGGGRLQRGRDLPRPRGHRRQLRQDQLSQVATDESWAEVSELIFYYYQLSINAKTSVFTFLVIC